MTLPAAGSSISASQINVELGYPSRNPISINTSIPCRDLFGQPETPGTTINYGTGLGRAVHCLSASFTSTSRSGNSFGRFSSNYGVAPYVASVPIGTPAIGSINSMAIALPNWTTTDGGYATYISNIECTYQWVTGNPVGSCSFYLNLGGGGNPQSQPLSWTYFNISCAGVNNTFYRSGATWTGNFGWSWTLPNNQDGVGNIVPVGTGTIDFYV